METGCACNSTEANKTDTLTVTKGNCTLGNLNAKCNWIKKVSPKIMNVWSSKIICKKDIGNDVSIEKLLRPNTENGKCLFWFVNYLEKGKNWHKFTNEKDAKAAYD